MFHAWDNPGRGDRPPAFFLDWWISTLRRWKRFAFYRLFGGIHCHFRSEETSEPMVKIKLAWKTPYRIKKREREREREREEREVAFSKRKSHLQSYLFSYLFSHVALSESYSVPYYILLCVIFSILLFSKLSFFYSLSSFVHSLLSVSICLSVFLFLSFSFSLSFSLFLFLLSSI